MNDNAMIKLDNSMEEYNSLIDQAHDIGMALAQAEKEYRMELSKYLAKCILEGKKVTVLGDMARGDEVVAPLRFERDKMKVLYDTVQEQIWALKTKISIIKKELELEYGRS